MASIHDKSREVMLLALAGAWLLNTGTSKLEQLENLMDQVQSATSWDGRIKIYDPEIQLVGGAGYVVVLCGKTHRGREDV
jgi:hypothetical protein